MPNYRSLMDQILGGTQGADDLRIAPPININDLIRQGNIESTDPAQRLDASPVNPEPATPELINDAQAGRQAMRGGSPTPDATSSDMNDLWPTPPILPSDRAPARGSDWTTLPNGMQAGPGVAADPADIAAHRLATNNPDPYASGGALAHTLFGTPDAAMAQQRGFANNPANFIAGTDHNGNLILDTRSQQAAHDALLTNALNSQNNLAMQGVHGRQADAAMLTARNHLEAARVTAQGHVDAQRLAHEHGPESINNQLARMMIEIRKSVPPDTPDSVVRARAMAMLNQPNSAPAGNIAPPSTSDGGSWGSGGVVLPPTVPPTANAPNAQRSLLETTMDAIRQRASAPGGPVARTPDDRIGALVAAIRANPQAGDPWINQNIGDVMDYVQGHLGAGDPTRRWWQTRTSSLGTETQNEAARRVLAQAIQARLGATNPAAPRVLTGLQANQGLGLMEQLFAPPKPQQWSALPPDIVQLLRAQQAAQ